LSPLLFLLFLEPLLRWLDVGGHGYLVASAGDASPAEPPLRITSAAFVDDIALATGTPEAAQRQLNKVHRFGAWAGISLNAPKCAITHLAFGAAGGPLGAAPARAAMSAVTLPGPDGGRVSLPMLGPHDTYRYLGIHLSACFDTREELEAIRHLVTARGSCLVGSFASMRQTLRVLNSNIAAAVRYHLILGVFRLPSGAQVHRRAAAGSGQAHPGPARQHGRRLRQPLSRALWPRRHVPSLRAHPRRSHIAPRRRARRRTARLTPSPLACATPTPNVSVGMWSSSCQLSPTHRPMHSRTPPAWPRAGAPTLASPAHIVTPIRTATPCGPTPSRFRWSSPLGRTSHARRTCYSRCGGAASPNSTSSLPRRRWSGHLGFTRPQSSARMTSACDARRQG
jgi:hypothetical protein